MIGSRNSERIATAIFYLIALLVSVLLAALIGYILYQGLPVINWHFLTAAPLPYQAGGGIGPEIFNSLMLLVLTMALTVPLGLGVGIYLSEYAREGRITRAIRICIESLASMPSIVIGIFGLMLFVVIFKWGFSVISGVMALTALNLPVMTRLAEDAIKNVSPDLREASLALGATQWQTITNVVLVAAIPGLVTGIILSAGRVFGEAAALLYTAGTTTSALNFTDLNPFSNNSPFYLLRPAETLAVHIWQVNSEGLNPDATQIANGASAVLVIMVLIFNLVSRWAGNWLFSKKTGQ
jgi:phosphate transport system permease protein